MVMTPFVVVAANVGALSKTAVVRMALENDFDKSMGQASGCVWFNHFVRLLHTPIVTYGDTLID